MSKRVTRATAAGRAYLDLQKLARRTGANTDDLLRAYVFEQVLRHVAASERANDLVLKGGMLLAVLDLRRPTVDIDMLARGIQNDPAAVEAMVREVLGSEIEDYGVSFEPDKMTSRTIREDDIYSGVRVELPAGVATARIKLKLDFNFGDRVVPEPVLDRFPALLEGDASFEVLCYSLETVLAEKIETMIRRGDANTRWRDFADVLLAIRRHPLAARNLDAALRATCSDRGTDWMTLASAIEKLPTAGQRQWETFCKQRKIRGLPTSFAEVIDEIRAFADPLIEGKLGGHFWSPSEGWHILRTAE